jgi:hypothetical protein
MCEHNKFGSKYQDKDQTGYVPSFLVIPSHIFRFIGTFLRISGRFDLALMALQLTMDRPWMQQLGFYQYAVLGPSSLFSEICH